MSEVPSLLFNFKGGDSSPIFCCGETLLGVLCLALDPSAQKRHQTVRAHKSGPRAGTPLLQEKAETVEAERAEACSAWRREGSRETLEQPSST